MKLFPAISLTDSTPFILKRSITGPVPSGSVLKHLVAWVDSGSGTVYCGNVPKPAITFENCKTAIGSKLLSFSTLPDAGNPKQVARKFSLGDVFSSTANAADDGNYVVGIEDNLLEFRNAFTVAFAIDAACALTPPDVSSTNGLPIIEGGERQWVSDRDTAFLSNPIKFVVATGGTATLRIGFED